MRTDKPDSETRPGKFQFGLFSIFVLTTVCAAIAGLTRLIDVPLFVRYLFGGYLFLLVIPLVLRMPRLLRTWMSASAELKRIRAERERLQVWADQRRREYREASGDGDQDE